jgi:hypothetical protein
MNSVSILGSTYKSHVLIPPDLEDESLSQPSEPLDEPDPRTPRGKQVKRLRELGMYKAAGAVSGCGRLGEKITYACGRTRLHKILRSHLRFCCHRCDLYVAERTLRSHLLYRERLNPNGVLQPFTVRTTAHDLSPSGIRQFEDNSVKSLKRWLVGLKDWGFKFQTQFDKNGLVLKGFVYFSPEAQFPQEGLDVPNSVCAVGQRLSVSSFSSLLSEIVQPPYPQLGATARAELMAAFQGGNHLRSAGVLNGLISKERAEKLASKDNADLCQRYSESGTGFGNLTPLSLLHSSCPNCGSACKPVSVSLSAITEADRLPILSVRQELRASSQPYVPIVNFDKSLGYGLSSVD